jgi:D-amino-acid dehydrogenase
LIEQEAFAVEYEQRGVLMAFKDPKVMADYEKTNRLLESYGLAASFHDGTAVRRLEPALNDGVCGGWHHRADSHLRPESLLDAWTAVIEQAGVALNGGCTLEEFLVHGDTVTGARTTSGDFTADACVLAAGVWSPRLARQLKLRIPVAAGKGYSLTMERPAVCPSIPCYLYERSVVATPWSSGYRLGGTMEFAGFDTRLNERRLESLKQAAAMYLRAPLGRAIGEPWAGLRPMCVDDLPIIDRAPGTRNLYLATGHGMLGLSTATGTGRLLGDLILGRPPCIDPEPYSIGRFRR